MKKKTKKLGLSRETLTQLSNEDLPRVVGGYISEQPVSFCICASKSICITCTVC